MTISQAAKFNTSLFVTDLRMRSDVAMDTINTMLPIKAKHKMNVWTAMMAVVDNPVAASVAVTFFNVVIVVVAIACVVFGNSIRLCSSKSVNYLAFLIFLVLLILKK